MRSPVLHTFSFAWNILKETNASLLHFALLWLVTQYVHSVGVHLCMISGRGFFTFPVFFLSRSVRKRRQKGGKWERGRKPGADWWIVELKNCAHSSALFAPSFFLLPPFHRGGSPELLRSAQRERKHWQKPHHLKRYLKKNKIKIKPRGNELRKKKKRCTTYIRGSLSHLYL